MEPSSPGLVARASAGLLTVCGTLTFAALLAALNGPAVGDEPPRSAAHHDLVIFDRERPFFLRLDLCISGEPQVERWLADLRRQIAAVDSNGDGAITESELQIPESKRDHQTADQPFGHIPKLWEADVSPFDGRITALELAALARSRQNGPVEFVVPVAGRATGDSTLGDRLFATLDRDSDGRLSPAELSSATESFRQIDFDEDGTISADELQSADPYYRSFVQARDNAPTLGVPIFSLSAGDSATELARRIRQQYGDAGGSIGPSALGLEPPVFDRCDADANGELDFDELRYFLRHPVPSLVLAVDLGRADPKSPSAAVWPPDARPAVPVRTSETGLVSLVLALGQLEVRCLDPIDDTEITSSLQAHFQGLDRDNNRYLDQKEVASDRLIGPVFSACDRNGDGQLFEDELLAVFTQSLQSARSRTQISAVDRGRDLFAILDADGNRRIGQREFEALTRRIGLWDEDADGSLRPAEVPQVYQLSLGPGRPLIAGRSLPITMGGVTSGNGDIAAPSWFAGMDRNGDGGISAREFLGAPQDFSRFDQNQDGLIDAAEANRIRQ